MTKVSLLYFSILLLYICLQTPIHSNSQVTPYHSHQTLTLTLENFRPVIIGESCQHQFHAKILKTLPKILGSKLEMIKESQFSVLTIGKCDLKMPYVIIRLNHKLQLRDRCPIIQKSRKDRSGYHDYYKHVLFSDFLPYFVFQNNLAKFILDTNEDLDISKILFNGFININSNDPSKFYEEMIFDIDVSFLDDVTKNLDVPSSKNTGLTSKNAKEQELNKEKKENELERYESIELLGNTPDEGTLGQTFELIKEINDYENLNEPDISNFNKMMQREEDGPVDDKFGVHSNLIEDL